VQSKPLPSHGTGQEVWETERVQRDDASPNHGANRGFSPADPSVTHTILTNRVGFKARAAASALVERLNCGRMFGGNVLCRRMAIPARNEVTRLAYASNPEDDRFFYRVVPISQPCHFRDLELVFDGGHPGVIPDDVLRLLPVLDTSNAS
jgi:hypothetical protein